MNNKIKKSAGSITFDIFNYVFLFLLSVIMVYPLLNVVAVSFSSADAITAGKVSWLPIDFNIHGYEVMLRNSEIFVAYKNTIIYTVLGTLIALLVCSLVAYTLAVRDFVFRKLYTGMLVFTMFFNAGLIPNFLNIKNLGLLDSIWAIILPSCVSAYNVFVFRTFFSGVSNELREAAQIDGANEFLIWQKIFVPLSKAVFATIALFEAVNRWNAWFDALLYLNDTTKFPLQMILRKIVILDEVRGGSYADSEVSNMIQSYNIHSKNIQMAAIVISMVPILMVYPFIQKYFAKGVMLGSVKG